MGMTKQRFILLQTDRLLWFKKGDTNDCILGEIPITPQTEICKHAANLVASEKMTIKTGSKELDLMPIKMGDIDEWAAVIQQQIELRKKVEQPVAEPNQSAVLAVPQLTVLATAHCLNHSPRF